MKILTSLIAATLLANPCSAASVTNSITYYDHQLTDSWYTGSTNVLFVPHFNPQIGIPLKATVYLKLNITNNFYFENQQSVSFYKNDLTGTINVTNTIDINFFGIEVLTLVATNTIDVAGGYDGLTDFAGPSGGKSTNIVHKTVVFDVLPEYISGYSVWAATNKSTARSFMRINGGAFTAGVRTTSGVDIWAVYTYKNEYNCPDCDKDKDCQTDKDKDKDKDDKSNKIKKK